MVSTAFAAGCDGQSITDTCKKQYSMMQEPEKYMECSKREQVNCNLLPNFNPDWLIIIGIIAILVGFAYWRNKK